MNQLSIRWVIPVAVIAVLAIQATKISKTISAKATAQESVTESVLRWKQGVTAVADSNKRWESVYSRDSEIQDTLSIIAQLQLQDTGLYANADSIFVNKINSVKNQGIELGLTEVCLGSAEAGDQVEVKAANYGALLSGVRALSQRPQVNIGSIKITGDNDQPAARLGDLCVLLRTK